MNTPFELKIRSRTVLAGEGETLTAHSVFCPRRARSVSVQECQECDHCRTIDRAIGGGGVVCCDGPRLALGELPKLTGSPASRTPIGEVMTTSVRCVLEDVGVEEVVELMLGQGVSGVPVVDTDGVAIGVVSKTDLLRDRGPRVLVSDIMTPIAFSLHERAPLAHAAAVMAVEGVHRVPVVGEEGQVVGILSTLDITRWLAKQEGLL